MAHQVAEKCELLSHQTLVPPFARPSLVAVSWENSLSVTLSITLMEASLDFPFITCPNTQIQTLSDLVTLTEQYLQISPVPCLLYTSPSPRD